MIKRWKKYYESTTEVKIEIVQEVLWFYLYLYNGNIISGTELTKILRSFDILGDEFDFYESRSGDLGQYTQELYNKCKKDDELYTQIIELYSIARHYLGKLPEVYRIEDAIINFIDEGFTFFLEPSDDVYILTLEISKEQMALTVENFQKYLPKFTHLQSKLNFGKGCTINEITYNQWYIKVKYHIY